VCKFLKGDKMKNYKKEGGHMAKVKKVSNTDEVQATIK